MSPRLVYCHRDDEDEAWELVTVDIHHEVNSRCEPSNMLAVHIVDPGHQILQVAKSTGQVILHGGLRHYDGHPL